MSSYQRKHGQLVHVWRMITVIDSRGNKTLAPDPVNPHEVRAAFIPQRSSRAEIPGQQEITVYRMIVDSSLQDVGLWSRILWDGELWDVVAPPVIHYGTKAVRHWAVDIRQRPVNSG